VAKNVVVCCDRTANELAEYRTNVVKLFFPLCNNPGQQVACYHPGIGTMAPPGALTGVAKHAAYSIRPSVGARERCE
jgi:uncharacterized protein (DUF2235 family)